MRKFFNKLVGCLALLVCPLIVLYGQALSVSGRVTATDDRAPLPGVNVSVDGTTTGTTTGADGTYRLNLPSANVTVVFSYIGYVTQRVVAGSRTQPHAA